MGLLRIPPDVSGSRNSKMATAKPEVLIYRLDKIVTPFQRLTPFTYGGIRYSAIEFLDADNGGSPLEWRCYLV